ncbi:U3 small nucleolar ribonucleoprotein complex, subunit Mpp10 [Kalaharituber pfeilii]|nr:U3 small nucleolar ribonucleoprotein complex, subunit Mpp10 [Kalaharituber pfeilii]
MSSILGLTSSLKNSPHDFLHPTPALHAASLMVAKQFLDPIAASIASKSRQKNPKGDTVVLDKIYLDGFDVEQVWEQVRILVGEVEGSLENALLKNSKAKAEKGTPPPAVNGKKRKAVQFDVSEETSGSDEEEQSGVENSEEENDNEDKAHENGSEDDSEEGFGGEGDEDVKLQDDDLEGIEALEGNSEDADEENAETYVQDVHGLNDGFFSIDEFNRQTEMFEQLDANGDAFDTDEEIDYNVDPAQLKISSDKGSEDEEDEEDEEDGNDFEEDLGDEVNANGIMYDDFFVPPPKKGLSKSQQKKQSWKNAFPKKTEEEEEQELARVQADMERAKRDLFDDDISEDDNEGEPGDPASRKSTYEKRQAELNEQIRKLELANISKKAWTLSGEARSTQRPLNSLLEEDLDFERIGKPVPVITQEVTEGLEDMIKRRILCGEFDELQKRGPTDVSAEFRRGRVELDDSKPQVGLAEIYEKDHLQSVDPANHPSAKDEKLQKEYAEIKELFNDVTKKLDALSSWHYTPKPPKPSITIVSDAPAISMEEAQPTTGGGGSAAAEASMLAPQEVYNPTKDRKDAPKVPGTVKEIIGKSAAPVSVAEMTTEEKQKRRKQNKERQRKKNATEGKTHGGKAKEGSKKDVIDTLKKGGVKVIGKSGEKRDVQGNMVKEKKAITSSKALKL